MNLQLITNLTGFENDLCDVIRLFFEAFELVSENPDYEIKLEYSENSESENMQACVEILINGEQVSHYQHSMAANFPSTLEKKRYMKRVAKISLFRALKSLLPDTFTPWGSLTGIRPTHLLRELEEETNAEQAKEMFLQHFDVEIAKYEYAKQIIDIQKPIIQSIKPNDIDIYIGIPYCKTKCLYCSFPSAVRTKRTDMGEYINALKSDISQGATLLKSIGYSIRSIYIGGGTPTVLDENELYDLLSHTLSCYDTYGLEFTVEAGRPDTITPEKLKILKNAGVTRLSINPQTMNESTLKTIGRSHSAKDIITAYEQAKALGFDINMDIIACLPYESEADFAHTLNEISKFDIENLTVHTLAIKRASTLKEAINDWKSSMPDSETGNNMLNMAHKTAQIMQMQPYYMYRQKYMRGNLENIGFAKAGKECIYNIDMMEEMTSIMAHGAGAMTKRIYKGSSLRVERLPNPKDIKTYINKQQALFEGKEKLFRCRQ